MSKLIFEVGYNSRGSHKAFSDGKQTNGYFVWRSMIERCYSAKYHEKCPTYIGCSVANEWHDFQDFAEWFYNNPYTDKGYHLDKDILIKGNKVYSSETCCLVPQELNKLLTSRDRARGVYPEGVSLKKGQSRFLSQISIEGKRKHLGYFDCPNKAHQAYKKAKERNVRDMAVKWRDRIADNVFNALMNWSL